MLSNANLFTILLPLSAPGWEDGCVVDFCVDISVAQWRGLHTQNINPVVVCLLWSGRWLCCRILS